MRVTKESWASCASAVLRAAVFGGLLLGGCEAAAPPPDDTGDDGAGGAVATATSAAAGAAGAAVGVINDAYRRSKLSTYSTEELTARANADAKSMKRMAGAANRLTKDLRADVSLFNRGKDDPLTADERARALTHFADVLDHCHALDAMVRFHLDFWRVNPVTHSDGHAQHFDLGFLAYLEKLALALAFVDATINKPQFERLFDEGSHAYGIPAGAYGRLKWNVVHVEGVAKVLAAHHYLKVLALSNKRLRAQSDWAFVQDRIDERYAEVKSTLTRKSTKLFGGNSVDISFDLAHAAWFPVQAETAEWLGDTKVRRLNTMLISEAQLNEAIARTEPGDVIVERRNWYLSNIGLPGFWPHAALWVGSPEELSAWSDDPEVTAAFQRPFTLHLSDRYPAAWAAYVKAAHDGHPHRIIEAVSEGVVFSAAQESIRADYVAAMRPLRSKVERAIAIEKAFSYHARPYDFDFDFYTDSALVCSELVFKSYEPRAGFVGLSLGLEKVVGRMTLGPNSIVRTFDEQAGTKDAQLAFVWFLDGREKTQDAAFADEAAFRASWRRPKWDFVQQ
jgi:hypothetical protein